MRLKHLLVVPALTIAAMAFAGPASAAPNGPQGKIEQGPQHANSFCSYSGLNDTSESQVQSFGQLVRVAGQAALKAEGEHPSLGCNGHDVPLQQIPH